MDFQSIMHNMIAAKRAESLANSKQLTLGELIAKLEPLANDMLIEFDFDNTTPTGLGSWRGSYSELAISINEEGYDGYQVHNGNCPKDAKYGYYTCNCKSKCVAFNRASSRQFLEGLKEVIGKYFTGYKGGDFKMTKQTPVWVANYGASGISYKNQDYVTVAIVDVKEIKGKILLITEQIDY